MSARLRLQCSMNCFRVGDDNDDSGSHATTQNWICSMIQNYAHLQCCDLKMPQHFIHIFSNIPPSVYSIRCHAIRTSQACVRWREHGCLLALWGVINITERQDWSRALTRTDGHASVIQTILSRLSNRRQVLRIAISLCSVITSLLCHLRHLETALLCYCNPQFEIYRCIFEFRVATSLHQPLSRWESARIEDIFIALFHREL